ncbi:MAG: hypothetical protein LBS21_03335 [Clostridiales bacterium]|jgi:hypothetical protein|nr:hypothetical protein [Clostridiales bacterium]
MKKSIRLLKVLTVILIYPMVFVMVFAAQPGTQEDPIVSKSYVDSKISEVIGLIAAMPPAPPEAAQENTGAFVPVSILTGQIVLGGEGAEIILRSGKVVAYNSGPDGLVNVTSGEEVTNGDDIAKNNLLIVPRSDGRGVMALEDSWLIIKGGYEIIN